MEVRYFTVQEKLDEVYGTLKQKGRTPFVEMFVNVQSRGEVIAIFLAVLEAVRFGRIDVEREEDTVYLELSPSYEELPEEPKDTEFE